MSIKKDISNFNFAELAHGPHTKESLADFRYASDWALPQLDALLGSKVPIQRNANGLISFSKMLSFLGSESLCFDNGNVVTRNTVQGILEVLTTASRSTFVQARMTTGVGKRYSPVVPLIPAMFKQFRNINYSEWDWLDPKAKYFLDRDILALAPLLGVYENPFSTEDLLAFRGQGDVTKYAIVSKLDKSTEGFKELPRLARIILTQVWVSHPSIRSAYAISNLRHLDAEAAALLGSDILLESKDDMWEGLAPSTVRQVLPTSIFD